MKTKTTQELREAWKEHVKYLEADDSMSYDESMAYTEKWLLTLIAKHEAELVESELVEDE